MSNLPKAALAEAASHLGEREATGNNDGPFVEAIQHWLEGAGETWMDGQPWCAAFASWCISRAGKALAVTPAMPPSGSSSDIYAWAKKHGTLCAPKANCVGLMKVANPESDQDGKTHHHTFLVESVDGAHVNGIDGNWQNQVMRTKHAVAECDFCEIV